MRNPTPRRLWSWLPVGGGTHLCREGPYSIRINGRKDNWNWWVRDAEDHMRIVATGHSKERLMEVKLEAQTAARAHHEAHHRRGTKRLVSQQSTGRGETQQDGTSGQDRESYSDTQDRENYT